MFTFRLVVTDKAFSKSCHYLIVKLGYTLLTYEVREALHGVAGAGNWR